MAGMFKKAETIAKPDPKTKKKDKEQIRISGLQQLTILDAAIKQLTAMQSTLKAEVNQVGFTRFTELVGSSIRPSSFEGVDGNATASIEIRKRSSASALTDDEVVVLEEAGLKPETKIISPHLFAINPTYASNEDLLAKVEKAISKIVPEDFIVQQEEVSRKVVTDAMLDDAFRGKASPEVLKILTTMAVKPKLNESYNMGNLMQDVMEIVQPAKKPAKLTKNVK